MLQRNEYPRPQFRREHWQGLNGEWEFAFDDDNRGVKRGLWKGNLPLERTIIVPFSYQYPASGIGDTTQHDTVWYRRKFTVAIDRAKRRAVLCFNAAYYRTDVWINGVHALSHEGGFAPFCGDVTDCLCGDENVIVVRCRAESDGRVPRGKQSVTGKPYGCFYLPNTGIWQSVWLDFTGADYMAAYTLLPDYDQNAFYGAIDTAYAKADELEITGRFEGKVLQCVRMHAVEKQIRYRVQLPWPVYGDYDWTPENPRLIDVHFTLYKNGEAVDFAQTRFGMRKIGIDESGRIYLNHAPLYQKLILDQGYWPESGLTPPSAEALKKDILLCKAMGFNGARKHQKLEDPYYCYYAEELGFLTWCEMPSAHCFCDREIATVVREWQEILGVAKNQTSTVCYVPVNESWGVKQISSQSRQQDFVRGLYYLTKSLDDTRLVSANDGFENIETSDILAVHDYDIATADDFAVKYGHGYEGLYPQGWPLLATGQRYKGQPVLFTEFGGIALQKDQTGNAWGYHGGAGDGEDLLRRLQELVRGIKDMPFQGYCYTQLTDVQQEVNGLLYADRTPKVSLENVKKILTE